MTTSTYRSVILGLGLAVLLGGIPGRSWADKVGDPAASLTVLEWIKGEPIEVKAGTNIVIIEFWAALSPACRAAIPTLNDLQNKYRDKGVVVLGVSDEPPDKIRTFVELTGTKVDFRVAADDRRKTARSYMVAYGQNGIPHAFIVGKDGKVLWHGHPMVGMDKALEQILAGTYDLAKATKVDALRSEVDEYLAKARRDPAAAKELGRKVLAGRTNDVARLCDFAYRVITDTANRDRDFALATEALRQVENAAGPKLPELVMVRGFLLYETGKVNDGLAMVKEAVSLAKEPKEKQKLEVFLQVLQGRAEADRKAKAKAMGEKQ